MAISTSEKFQKHFDSKKNMTLKQYLTKIVESNDQDETRITKNGKTYDVIFVTSREIDEFRFWITEDLQMKACLVHALGLESDGNNDYYTMYGWTETSWNNFCKNSSKV